MNGQTVTLLGGEIGAVRRYALSLTAAEKPVQQTGKN